MKKPTLICVVGPTAIGKTSLGIKLAQKFKADVISADSRQIYKGMPIGTAAPTAEEQSQAKHHFVEFLTPDKLYSAGDFEKDAIKFLEEYFKTCPIAIMVGGSGLYVKGVVEGFDHLPAELEIRKTLNARFEAEGIEPLQGELEKLDPMHYSKMDTKNPQRVIRALEVCLTTGKPFSSFHKSDDNADKKAGGKAGEKAGERPFDIIQVGLEAPREVVNERIAKRTQIMLDQGWVEETKKLLQYRDENSLNTVGYKEIFAHLDGDMTLEEAQERIVISTRQFAKRQMTWFRKDKSITWFDYQDADKAIEFVEKQLS